MYTIREAAARTGVPVALLRAWERRYGIVSPTRTAGGYRLYDDAALERLRTMRRLVDEGWAPSVAAGAILRGEVPASDSVATASEAASDEPGRPFADDRLIADFVDAAIALDPSAVEAALDRIFAAGTFEAVVDRILVPALVGIGEAWADGRLGVAGEHAASHAVLRRLSGAFQAAGRAGRSARSILVGLPAGGRHELAALAFSVAARRAGLAVTYLGPDLPPDEWVTVTRRVHPRAVVVGCPTAADVASAIAVGQAVDAADPSVVVAFGGRHAGAAAQGFARPSAIVLPDGLIPAVDALRAAISAGPGPALREAETSS